MDNFFINQRPFSQKTTTPLIEFVNKGIKFLKFGYYFAPLPDPTMDMNTIEQRINYYHLLNNVIGNQVEGDVVEMGCFTGHCAMLFQKIIQQHKSSKVLHLFDSFQAKFTLQGSVEDELRNNFRKASLDQPVLHKGYFQDTMPTQLPDKISFAHIDCGFGGDKIEHKNIVLGCLKEIYPRMSKDAVCVLMDYHDSLIHTHKANNNNPGVKLACDEFFATRPESVVSLYGNKYSHGYFKKM